PELKADAYGLSRPGAPTSSSLEGKCGTEVSGYLHVGSGGPIRPCFGVGPASPCCSRGSCRFPSPFAGLRANPEGGQGLQRPSPARGSQVLQASSDRLSAQGPAPSGRVRFPPPARCPEAARHGASARRDGVSGGEERNAALCALGPRAGLVPVRQPGTLSGTRPRRGRSLGAQGACACACAAGGARGAGAGRRGSRRGTHTRAGRRSHFRPPSPRGGDSGPGRVGLAGWATGRPGCGRRAALLPSRPGPRRALPASLPARRAASFPVGRRGTSPTAPGPPGGDTPPSRGAAGGRVSRGAGGAGASPGPGSARPRGPEPACRPQAMAHQERTFIAIKPDGVQRGLVGDIVKRFEQKGFRLVAMKFLRASEDLLKEHYIDLKDRPFYPGLVKYMHSGPVVAMVWEGLNVVKTGRMMLGETNPADSKPGTIRGDFCIQVGRNIIHGSDSVKSAEKEISLWFKPEELVDYKSCAFDWIYE
uniref:Nucleoside diphosphate kinase n=1 Tax=Canis lupus familiaris TaxID=9615 RepID=A0A8C0TZ32_CANLF